MTWCRQATSHCLKQCWPRSLPPYNATRPQWVNLEKYPFYFDQRIILSTLRRKQPQLVPKRHSPMTCPRAMNATISMTNQISAYPPSKLNAEWPAGSTRLNGVPNQSSQILTHMAWFLTITVTRTACYFRHGQPSKRLFGSLWLHMMRPSTLHSWPTLILGVALISLKLSRCRYTTIGR